MKTIKTIAWEEVAMLLAKNTEMSWREIARQLDVSKSTCSDYLRKNLK